MTTQQAAIDRIARERLLQDAKHGGPEHDDTHDPRDWMAFLVVELAHAGDAFDKGFPSQFQASMFQVAALAIAAIESTERKYILSERKDHWQL